MSTPQARLDLPRENIVEFCRRWRIVELALFGSILRDDYRDDSDVDFLVTFEDNHPWSLFDHMHMEDELCEMLGRKVDLVSRRGLENSRNYLRKANILDSVHVIYGRP